MKIFIDEKVFNQAIKEGKLELAEWLIEQNCPRDSSAYLQNMDITVLKWLYSKGVEIDRGCMYNVVKVCDDEETIKWFIDKGVAIDASAINACIKLKDISYVMDFLTKYDVKLNSTNYEIAIMTENIPVLNLLKQTNCPYDKNITEKALKYCKKRSVKWLVENDLFDL